MKNHRRGWVVVVFICLFLTRAPALAQVATGTPNFGTFTSGSFDTINLSNLNVHFDIPIVSKDGRGMPFSFSLGYDNSIWIPDGYYGHQWQLFPIPQTAFDWGWKENWGQLSGIVTRTITSEQCTINNRVWRGYIETDWTFYDGQGTPHHFPGWIDQCYGPTTLNSTAMDGSGFSLAASDTLQTTQNPPAPQVAIYTRSGKHVDFSGVSDPNYPIIAYFQPTGSITDSNGNSISRQKDTSGAVAVTAPNYPYSDPYQFTAPDGTLKPVKYIFTMTLYAVDLEHLAYLRVMISGTLTI